MGQLSYRHSDSASPLLRKREVTYKEYLQVGYIKCSIIVNVIDSYSINYSLYSPGSGLKMRVYNGPGMYCTR